MATLNEVQSGSSNAANQPAAGSNGSTAAASSGNGGTAPQTTSSSVTTTTTAAKTTLLGTLANLARGVSGYLLADSTLSVNGRSLSVSQILATLNGYIGSGNTVASVKSQLKADLTAWNAEKSAARAFAVDLKAAVIQALGKQSPLLAQFGLSPPKRTKLTTQQLATRAAKNKATRELRGTKGPQQKAQIRYTGPAQVTVVTQAGGGSGASPAAASAAVPASPAGPSPAVASVATTTVPTAVKPPQSQ
jgi:hypothetical protein